MFDDLQKTLFREPQGVLSIVGAGGKTSLMFGLARLLTDSGKKVLTTTTTKINIPTIEQSENLLVSGDLEYLLNEASFCLNFTKQITAAAEYMPDSGKLKGFAFDAIQAFADSSFFDWILVEADGASALPLKAPASHEPAIPSCTTVLVAVAGLDVLGKPLSSEHVFRCEEAGRVMGLTQGDPVTEEHLVRLFTNPSGSFKNTPVSARRFIFLNKADDLKRCESAARISSLLSQMKDQIIEAVIVGKALDGLTINAVYPMMASP